MNLRDLIGGKKFDAPARAFKTLIQIFTRFFFGVGCQLDDMKTLFVEFQLVQISDQRRLTKQEYMGASLWRTGRQRQQRFQGGLVELLGIIHQQIDFLPGQRQLDDLVENRAHFSLGQVQRLGDLAQHTGGITGATGRNHHALHRLLVGAGHQGLAQQGLATALGAGDYQQQLAVARQVMQLPQHRFALGREELEAGDPWSKGVMTQLEMAEESLVGMQTSHRNLINL